MDVAEQTAHGEGGGAEEKEQGGGGGGGMEGWTSTNNEFMTKKFRVDNSVAFIAWYLIKLWQDSLAG